MDEFSFKENRSVILSVLDEFLPYLKLYFPFLYNSSLIKFVFLIRWNKGGKNLMLLSDFAILVLYWLAWSSFVMMMFCHPSGCYYRHSVFTKLWHIQVISRLNKTEFSRYKSLLISFKHESNMILNWLWWIITCPWTLCNQSLF